MRMQRRAAAARRQSAVASAASVSATLGSRPRLTLAEPGSVGTERGGTDVETDAERPTASASAAAGERVEAATERFDEIATRTLGVGLAPLVGGWAIYALVHYPHTTWYVRRLCVATKRNALRRAVTEDGRILRATLHAAKRSLDFNPRARATRLSLSFRAILTTCRAQVQLGRLESRGFGVPLWLHLDDPATLH